MDINKEYNDINEILKGHKPKIIEKDFYDLLLNEDIGRFMGESPDKDISVYVKIPMNELLQIKASIERVNQGKIHDLPLLATDIVNNIIQRYFSEEYIDPEDFVDLVVRDVGETTLATSGEPTDNTDVTPIKEGHKKEDIIDAIKSLLNSNTDNEKLKAILSILMPNAKGEIEIDETILSTANTPSDQDQPRTMKERSGIEKASLRNASYYRWGKYVEDLPIDIREVEDMRILTADEQLTLDIRDEDANKLLYAYSDEIDTDETGTSIKNVYAIKGEK